MINTVVLYIVKKLVEGNNYLAYLVRIVEYKRNGIMKKIVNRRKTLKIIIPAFITSAVCYTAMWAIMARTESAFFAGYIGGVGTVDQVKHILICILVGVILFVLPLEKICDKTYCVICYCGSLLTDKKKYKDGTTVFLLVFLYALVCWAGTVFSLCTDSGFDDGGHWGLF